MAAPILWAPGIFRFFLLENPHAHKISPFRGGRGVLGFVGRGGGSANFISMGVGIFPRHLPVLLGRGKGFNSYFSNFALPPFASG